MSKFNNLLKMSAFFLLAQKRKEIIVPKSKTKIPWDENDPNYQWNINTEDGNSGQFNEGTYISNDSDNRSSFSWNEQLVPDLNDDENRFPKSPYQEAVESLGDQKPDYNAIDKMVKSAKKGYLICIEHVGRKLPPLQNIYSKIKDKHGINGSKPIDRLISVYEKWIEEIKEINKSKIFTVLGRGTNNWYDVEPKLNKDKRLSEGRTKYSTELMNHVKDFFENMKIIYEVLGFEETSMGLPTEYKWPTTSEPQFSNEINPEDLYSEDSRPEWIGDEIITPKNDLKYIMSEYRKSIYELLQKLNEQIQIFDENKVDIISEPVKNW